jgi:hypothetical protein
VNDISRAAGHERRVKLRCGYIADVFHDDEIIDTIREAGIPGDRAGRRGLES